MKGKNLHRGNEYLTIEEQFKETLNAEEFSRIQDPELRKIRYNHWKYRIDVHHNEYLISDDKFCRLTDIDYKQEKKEIEEYGNEKVYESEILRYRYGEKEI